MRKTRHHMKFVNKHMGSLQNFAASDFFVFCREIDIYILFLKEFSSTSPWGFFINGVIAKIWVFKLCLAQSEI
jgi:hypothetical protein